MNRRIRKVLIEHAIKNKPIYYGQVMDLAGLKRGVNEDHAELSKLLADISRFEKKNKRPFLSAMATYTPTFSRTQRKGETHGNGFYELAEEFFRKNRYALKKQDFAIKQMSEAHKYWTDPEHYEKYFDIEEESNSEFFEHPGFFNEKDISLLNHWAGKVYEKNNPKHIKAKNLIIDTVGLKTVYWATEVVNRLKNFESYHPRFWSQKGWADRGSGNQRVSRFKHYTWARIYRRGDENRDIFFTVGANGIKKSLVYKIDYHFESRSKLSEGQKQLCEQLIPEEVSWLSIPVSKLHEYNWERLVSETVEFIKNNLCLYDEIVNSVWSNELNVSTLRNTLIRREIDDEGVDELPKRNFDFKGAEIDWTQLAADLNEIGINGEELVIEYERAKLRKANMEKYVKDVKKVKDGCGYDIISRYPDGRQKMIEVKTTTRGPKTPFPISITEVAFSALNPSNYVLYHLYNFDKTRRVAEFKEYVGNLNDHFLFEGIHFSAHKRRSEK